jgi:hypothetical protein
MKRLALSLVMSLVVVICLAPCAFSDSVTLTHTQYANGTGFGNVTNVLSLHHNGLEVGSVIPTSDATGNAAQDSKTWTAAQLSGLGFNALNLALVFNPAQSGNDTIDMNSFSLDFFYADGTTSQAILTNPTQDIIPLSHGTGTSGWLMTYNDTELLTKFFDDDTNVLGATGSLGNAAGAMGAASGGQDNFYLVNLSVPPPPVPEPTTMLLLGLGLIGLAGVSRKFRK